METSPLSTESLLWWNHKWFYSCRQYSDFYTHTPKGCCSLETKGVVPVEHKTAAALLGNGSVVLFADQLDRLSLLLTEVGMAYFALKWVGLKPKLVGGAQ